MVMELYTTYPPVFGIFHRFHQLLKCVYRRQPFTLHDLQIVVQVYKLIILSKINMYCNECKSKYEIYIAICEIRWENWISKFSWSTLWTLAQMQKKNIEIETFWINAIALKLKK